MILDHATKGKPVNERTHVKTFIRLIAIGMPDTKVLKKHTGILVLRFSTKHIERVYPKI
jgi:hypothetical protein